tara:strand:- start:9065 stop:9568 length:504 start_codon:yes stop_codon:yes gene_type:complete
MAWQIAAALIAAQVASTAVSVMASNRRSKNLKAAAAFDKYQTNLRKKQETIKENEAAAKLLSYQRAAAASGGGVVGTGTSLLIHDESMEDLNENLFWIEKGYEIELQKQDVFLSGTLAEESYRRKASIVQGATNLAITAYKADFSKSLFSDAPSRVPVQSRTGTRFG